VASVEAKAPGMDAVRGDEDLTVRQAGGDEKHAPHTFNRRFCTSPGFSPGAGPKNGRIQGSLNGEFAERAEKDGFLRALGELRVQDPPEH
jgi:hypothetical protein